RIAIALIGVQNVLEIGQRQLFVAGEGAVRETYSDGITRLEPVLVRILVPPIPATKRMLVDQRDSLKGLGIGNIRLTKSSEDDAVADDRHHLLDRSDSKSHLHSSRARRRRIRMPDQDDISGGLEEGGFRLVFAAR